LILTFPNLTSTTSTNSKMFYGWYIVLVGFLAQVNCAFHMSSTLSVFLKPLTEDLAVSRGVFSLLRSGEILLAGALAPFFGFVHDVTGSYLTSFIYCLRSGAGFFGAVEYSGATAADPNSLKLSVVSRRDRVKIAAVGSL
jgi:hypothetical protein